MNQNIPKQCTPTHLCTTNTDLLCIDTQHAQKNGKFSASIQSKEKPITNFSSWLMKMEQSKKEVGYVA